jgi:uncharacterized membrane protein
MSDSELRGLQQAMQEMRHEMRLDLARLEAKIDTKPSLMAMFTAVIVVVFGMFGVVASTVATLNSLGVLRGH